MAVKYKDKKEWLYKNKTRLHRNIDKVIKKNNVDVGVLRTMKALLDRIDFKKGGAK